MPRGHALPGARIFEGFVLQPGGMQPQLATDREQPGSVTRYEVRHRFAAQSIAMKPNAAVEGEAHPLAAAFKLSPKFCYWQVMRPSTVAGGIGGPAPANK